MKHPFSKQDQQQKQQNPAATDKPEASAEGVYGTQPGAEIADTVDVTDELPISEANETNPTAEAQALAACKEVNPLHPENVSTILPEIFMHLGTVLTEKRGTHAFYQSWARLTELHAQAKKGTE